jgi:hypothetical protein
MFCILSSQIQYSPGNMENFNIICFNYIAQQIFTLSDKVYKISRFFTELVILITEMTGTCNMHSVFILFYARHINIDNTCAILIIMM